MPLIVSKGSRAERVKAEWKKWAVALSSVLFPRLCIVCGKRLPAGTSHFCIHCLSHLPLTHFKGKENNVVERMVWDDEITTERANALLYYESGSSYCSLFFAFKYNRQPEVAVGMGRMMAQDLADTHFFDGIDYLLPVPLAKQRFYKRGYNQSERLAYGISMETGIPIDMISIERMVDNETQTHLTPEGRQQNVAHIFRLTSRQQLSGKHVLIIDDVCTTGATIRSLAHEALKAGQVRISVLCLAVSGYHRGSEFVHWKRP